MTPHFRSIVLVIATIVITMCAVSCSPTATNPAAKKTPSTIVFVHGAWGGGWQFGKVQPLLEKAGHRVFRPTMTGLGERVHLAGPEVDLSTHITDIVNFLEFEGLDEVTLVGHSYGGMVIAGVTEKVPQRVTKLVFMDAILPEDGESVRSLFGDAIDTMATLEGEETEPWQLVPRWVEDGQQRPVDVPQPVRTFTESIVLEDDATQHIPGAFILTVEAGKDTDDFDLFAERARDRGWSIVRMEGGHNPHWFQPEAFVKILLEVIAASPA